MAAGFEDDDFFDDQPRRDDTASDPEVRAREAAEQLRIHCELAATFEGPRKFDDRVKTGLDVGTARDLQQAIGKLEKQKTPKLGPVLPQEAMEAARVVLEWPADHPGLDAGSYHVHRRPGEAILVRWLAGDRVGRFYDRVAEHFNVAHQQRLEDEKTELGWRQDEDDQKYLESFEKIEPQPDVWYLRKLLNQHGLLALSTLAVEEMDILHLCDHLMGIPAFKVVGEHNAPDPDDPSPPESERVWYFKLFNLRGTVADTERMCTFAFLQRAGDELW